MSTKRSAYERDWDQHKIATAILEKERQTLSPTEEKNFRRLNLAVYGSLATFILLIIVHLLVENTILPIQIGEDLFGILILSTLAFFLVTLVLFGMNVRFLLRLWNQGRNVRTLGLSAALEAPWKAERKKNRRSNLFTLSVPFIWLGITLLGLLQGWLIGGTDSAGYWIAGLAILFLFFLALIVMHLSRRGRERLRVIERLGKKLAAKETDTTPGDGDPMALDLADHVLIAQIERAQIAADRAASIEADKKAPRTSYCAKPNAAVLRAMTRLDIETLLNVQKEIKNLTEHPPPSEAEAELQRKQVPGNTPVEITFSVDEVNKIIHIQSLDSAGGTALSSPEHGG